MTAPSGTAYIKGKFVPMEEAKISVLDWGFLHSDATYDVVHVWKRRFFRLGAHIDRFLESARRLHLTLPVSRPELERILAECVHRSGHEDAYVEMILTRGVSPTFSRDPRDAENQLICFAIPFGWVLRPEDRPKGLSIAISDIQRIPPQSVNPKVKNYHWLDFVMGLYDAYDRDAGSVVLQDGSGNVTEGPGFNIFMVKDGAIATPDQGILEGITRRSAIEIAREAGIQVQERAVSAEELRQADEVFASSTAGGIMPVTSVDGVTISGGTPGPVTSRLIETYWAKHNDPKWSVDAGELLRN